MTESQKNAYPPWRKHEFPGEQIDIDIPNGDKERGQQIFLRSCGGCHSLDENGWLGPALRDVFNRKIGSKKGFYYSTAMSLTKGHWTREKLFLFLGNPEDLIPHTAMFFDGIQDPKDRASVIEYLQSLKVDVDSKENEKASKKKK